MVLSINNKPWKPKEWTDVVAIDVKYKDRERSVPEVHIWRRTPAGKTHVVDPDLFPSYFYIDINNKDRIEQIEQSLFPHAVEYPAQRSIEGNSLIKLVYNKFTKTQFNAAREHFTNTWEADIKYKTRYLLDNNIKFSTNRRVCFFDIETDMSVDVKNTPAPILSIAMYDTLLNEAGMLLLDREIKGPPQYQKIGDNFLVKFGTETEMLKAFVNYVKIYNPDILCAYNLYEFDYPYLINRMKILAINFRDMSEINEVWVIVDEKDKESTKCHCGGRELIDWYVLVKKFYDEDKPDTFKLDDVAMKIIGEEKIKHEYKNLKELYEKDVTKFIEYNIQDVILMKKLEEKTGFITKYLVSLQQLVPMQLETMKDNSVVVDFYMLKSYNGKVIFPSKKRREDIDDKTKFKGAITGRFVEDPVTGEITSENPFKKVYENVVVIDFGGLYPNLFRTFNVSPDTLCIQGEPDSIGVDGVGFYQDKVGLLPALFSNLIELRKTYQKKADSLNPNTKEYDLYFNLSTAVKKVSNSVYGVTGFRNFRLYDTNVAKSITGFGQMFIKFTYKVLKDELGYDVIYGDTDSCFLILKSDLNNKEEFEKELDYLDKYINRRIEEKVMSMGSNNNYLVMDFEKRFKKLIFMGVKKRYIGKADYWKGKWLDKDKILIKGYDLVRKELAKPVKHVIRTIIEMFLDNVDKAIIKKYYKDSLKNIKKMPINELAWSKGLGKNIDEYKKVMPQHIKACIAAEQYLGLKFFKNDSPKIMYVKNLPLVLGERNVKKQTTTTDVIAFERDTVLPENILSRIDYDRFIQSFIVNKLDDFLGVEGMDMEYVIIENESTLNDFLGISGEIKGGKNERANKKRS